MQRISRGEQVSFVVRGDDSLNIALSLPETLVEYHRRLGVDHVFFLDKSVIDKVWDRCRTCP